MASAMQAIPREPQHIEFVMKVRAKPDISAMMLIKIESPIPIAITIYEMCL